MREEGLYANSYRGTIAGIDPRSMTFYYDPAEFRYIDMLHESRHFAQLAKNTLSMKQLMKTGVRNMFELGAYDYELRAGRALGFSESFLADKASVVSELSAKTSQFLTQAPHYGGLFY